MSSTTATSTNDKVPTVGGFFLSKRQMFRASTILVVLLISILSANKNSVKALQNVKESKWSIHLFSFACFYGCSMWVTFVAGLVMFKSLPRHTFGKLQAKLFPKYFQYSILWVGICLGLECFLLHEVDANHLLLPETQRYNLCFIMIILLMNLFALEPKTTKIMFQRHVVERKIGTGHEVGVTKPSPKLLESADKKDVELLSSLSKQFGKLHGISALLNLFALILGTWHLCWIGAQIRLD